MSGAIRFDAVTKTFVVAHDRPRSFQEAFVRAFRRTPAADRDVLVALDAVSFDVAPGTAVGLVGPNGTGKSTALKLVARILEPTAGRVVVDGRVAALLELGAGFHPDLTGRENVYLSGSLLGLGRREMGRRFDRIVAFSELERFIDVPVKHYSSGMYMRLGFATSIHLDAEILLIDEILAVGDQAFQHKCRERIAALRKAGLTILLVSHDTDAVRELCDRAIWLEDGLIRADGEPDAVLQGYYRHMIAREEARLAAEAGADADAVEAAAAATDRFGSGDVEITSVEVLGPDGTPHAIVLTGQAVTIRLHYHAHRPVVDPVFGIAIHRDDGTHVAGPNTRDAGLAIAAVDGPGVVDVALPHLPLLEGSYTLSAACYDDTLTHAYDHHDRRFPLRVRAGDIRERFGLLALGATWSHRAVRDDRGGGNGDGGGDRGAGDPRGAGGDDRAADDHRAPG